MLLYANFTNEYTKPHKFPKLSELVGEYNLEPETAWHMLRQNLHHVYVCSVGSISPTLFRATLIPVERKWPYL